MFVRGVEYILLGILIFFAVIELIALIIGTRMTRTVTSAVAQLYDATKNVDRGDFSHRIPVKSTDQLAQLSLVVQFDDGVHREADSGAEGKAASGR